MITSCCEIKIDHFIISIPAITNCRQTFDDSGNTCCDSIPSGCLKVCASQLTPLVEALFSDVFFKFDLAA